MFSLFYYLERELIFMFDVVQTFLIQFINVLPFLIPFVLVVNIASDLLFGRG